MRLSGFVYAFTAVSLFLLLLAPIGTIATAQGTTQSGRHWISLGPDFSTAAAGNTVTYRVSVRTSTSYFAGDVLVTLPSGLTVVGQPICSSGCWQTEVLKSSTETQIQTPITARIDGSASFSFDVQVDPNAVVGTSYHVAAYLLGGVNTAGSSETAFATLQVSDSSSHPNQPLEDEPPILFKPETLFGSPGETVRVTVVLQESLAEYRITVVVPMDLVVVSEPLCLRSDADVCTDGVYDRSVTNLANGSSEVMVAGTSVIGGPREFVIYIEIPADSSNQQFVIDGTLESVRRWGLEPVGEASMVIIIAGD